MSVARVLAVANHKGGCGKTTLAVHLASWLSRKGKTLLVDLDPQGHAGLCLGVRGEGARGEPGGTAKELRRFLEGGRDPRLRSLGDLDLLASDEELDGLEREEAGGDALLRDYLSMCLRGYAFIVVDSPPAAGRLGRMALVAADVLVVPVRTDFLSLAGVARMMASFYKVSATANPVLRLGGVAPTMADLRTRGAREAVEELRRNFGEEMMLPPLRLDVKFSQAAAAGRPIMAFAPRSRGAQDVDDLCRILWRRIRP